MTPRGDAPARAPQARDPSERAAADGFDLGPWRDRSLLLVTCEHAGNDVPASWRACFEGQAAVLASHLGWDAGALTLARTLALHLGAPLLFVSTTRLLVDANRSVGHRGSFSEFTRTLPAEERRRIVARHYAPHRQAVERAVARRIDDDARVVHVAVHSFTPSLDGIRERPVDVAWQYDPRRAGERAISQQWLCALAERMPDLRLRRNYPYRGKGDGLTKTLRGRHPADAYIGIELEVNQRLALGAPRLWRALRGALAATLTEVFTAPSRRADR